MSHGVESSLFAPILAKAKPVHPLCKFFLLAIFLSLNDNLAILAHPAALGAVIQSVSQSGVEAGN